MEDININNIVGDTLELVRINSETGDTTTLAQRYKQMLEKAGCIVESYEFIDKNPTLVARYGKAEKGAKKLIFNGHMDVVPLEQKDAYVEKGKVYGRGACDMKGSLAAILEVIRSINNSEVNVIGEIIIIANSLHESPGGRGEDLEALIEKEEVKEADAAVVMEGATYDCTIAQAGSATFNLTIKREGEPSHQIFTPPNTPHPISVMGEVIQALEEENEKLKKHYIENIGYGSYFIGNVASGNFYNQTPKTAHIEGVRRYSPKQKFKDVKKTLDEIIERISNKHDVEIDVDMRKVRDGYFVDTTEDIVSILANAVEKVRNVKAPLVGKQLVTDAGIISNGLNIPVVCSGPEQQQAHAESEFVKINELHLAAQIYMKIIEKFIGIKE